MKVLLINKYFYLKGGSERTFFNEANLLRKRGNNISFFSMFDEKNSSCDQDGYFIDNIDYHNQVGFQKKISSSLKLLYSFEAKKKIEALIKREQPDVAHLHNIHHQISPSIIHVLKNYDIPIVMTLHDSKMVCPAYTLTRNNHSCEKCKNGRYFWCLYHRCSQGSYIKSLINVVEMNLHHKILNIYDSVNFFISPSQFLQKKLIEMGFSKNIIYLPNFVNLRQYEPQYGSPGRTFCYFGRLSSEKGLFSLIEAMKGLNADLKIIGDGPLKSDLEKKVKIEKIDNIRILGYKSGDELIAEVGSSFAVVVPSECYENCPYTILEAFALGKPVIGADIGGIPELVKNTETGFTFEPRNPDDLRSKMKLLLRDHNLVIIMGKTARTLIEKSMNPENHYKRIMQIYQIAMEKN